MLTVSEKDVLATGATMFQWVPRDTVSAGAADCLILFTLPFKIFSEDSSGGWELGLDIEFFLVIRVFTILSMERGEVH